MIAAFPIPKPHELLYSVCARYLDHIGVGSYRRGLRNLFGRKVYRNVVDLPSHLRALSRSLPPMAEFQPVTLLHKHTLYPLYAAFLRPLHRQRLREAMLGDAGRRPHLISGAMADRVPPPEAMRYCPACLECEDEPYWSRLWQIPGVDCCAIHGIRLLPTSVRRLERQPSLAHVSARSVILSLPNRGQVEPATEMEIALARRAADVLEQGLFFDADELRSAFECRLWQLGFLTEGGRIRHRLLRQYFRRNRGIAMGSHAETSAHYADDWLTRSLRCTSRTPAPTRKLLVMEVLGVNLDGPTWELAVRKSESEPCPNPVCGFHGIPIASQLSHRSGGGLRQYRCDWCGQVFVKNSGGHLTIVRRGHLWAQTLANLWTNADLSLRCISSKLGADPLTIKRCAHDLDLCFPRPSKRMTHLPPSAKLHASRNQNLDEIAEHRKTWSQLARKGRTNSRPTKRETSTVYHWLYRHDRQWLRSHLRRRHPHPSHHHVVNWPERDRLLTERIYRMLPSILSVEPRHSVARICRLIGGTAWILKHPTLVPNAVATVRGLAEDHAAFATRREDQQRTMTI